MTIFFIPIPITIPVIFFGRVAGIARRRRAAAPPGRRAQRDDGAGSAAGRRRRWWWGGGGRAGVDWGCRRGAFIAPGRGTVTAARCLALQRRSHSSCLPSILRLAPSLPRRARSSRPPSPLHLVPSLPHRSLLSPPLPSPSRPLGPLSLSPCPPRCARAVLGALGTGRASWGGKRGAGHGGRLGATVRQRVCVCVCVCVCVNMEWEGVSGRARGHSADSDRAGG